MTMKQDQTYERFKLAFLWIDGADGSSARQSAWPKECNHLDADLFERAEPLQWDESTKKLASASNQDTRNGYTIRSPCSQKASTAPNALVVSKTTCDVECKLSAGGAETSRHEAHPQHSAIAIGGGSSDWSATRIVHRHPHLRPNHGYGLWAGPWIWKEADRRKLMTALRQLPLWFWSLATSRRECFASDAKDLLVFYNARTSFKTKQSTPRPYAQRCWGPSVDEIEPLRILHAAWHRALLRQLRTIGGPVLDGPGWKSRCKRRVVMRPSVASSGQRPPWM